MRINSIIYILLFIMFATLVADNINPEELRLSLNPTHDTLMNITNEIEYTNLYVEEPTAQNVLKNMIRPILYAILVEVNTIIPLSVHVAGNGITSVFVKLGIMLIILWIFLKIINILKGLITIYFFFKEKKKYGEKLWD